MKIKKTLYQSIKKDLIKGVRRFYWYSYTNIKYFFFTFIKYLKKKDNKMFSISLLLPTRERTEKFIRLLNSINETCVLKERLDLLLLIDEDDKEISLYKEISESTKYKDLNIKIYINSLKTHAQRNNFLANKTNNEIIFPINDDIVFKTNAWDTVIDEEFSKFGDKPYCLWTNSGQKYNYLHCDFPIINRKWFDKLGYVGSEHFRFWFLDTWICDLSFRSKQFLITDKIEIYQYSAHTIKEEIDDTHLKNLKDNIPQDDLNTWNNTLKYRISDAKKLK